MHWSLDGWNIDKLARTATRGNCVEQLSPRAIRLLEVLADAGGVTVSRSELLDRVWPNVFVSDESLTQVVAELRRTLDNKQIIATIPRGGYRLTVPVFGQHSVTASPTSPANGGLTLDAYTLCLEAKECFSRGHEGAQRTFVDLTAQAVAAAPGYAEARALHALALFKRHIYWSEGDLLLESVLEQVEATLALDPGNALAHLIDAATRLAIGGMDDWTNRLETALALAPNDPTIHFEAGAMLFSAGHHRAAAAMVTRAGDLNQQSFLSDMLASRILLALDPVRARNCAETALRKVQTELASDPNSLQALYMIGPILAQLGDHRAARTALESVTHHDSPLEYFRAMGFAQIGDVSSALERIDFLAMRGWRFVCILDKDYGFRPMFADHRFQKLHGELMAA